MVHVAESGDKLWTVRVASPRIIATATIREIATLQKSIVTGISAITTRNNVEFLVSDEKNLEPLKKDLAARGFKMGGIGYGITNVVHTQGWVHCHSACTDASGIVKAMMDELFEYFKTKRLPNKVRTCGSMLR